MQRLMLLVGIGVLLAGSARADYSLPQVEATYLLLVRPVAVGKAKPEGRLGRLTFVLPHDAKLDSDEPHRSETRLDLPIDATFMQDRIWTDSLCVGATSGPKTGAARVAAVRKDLAANRRHVDH